MTKNRMWSQRKGWLMDTYGYAKRRLTRRDPNLEQKLVDRILEIKDISRQQFPLSFSTLIQNAV